MKTASLLIVAALIAAGCQKQETDVPVTDPEYPPVSAPVQGSIGADTLAALNATSDSAVATTSLDAPMSAMETGPIATPSLSAPDHDTTPPPVSGVEPNESAVAHSVPPTGFGDQDLTVDLGAYARKVTNAPGERVYPRSATGVDIVKACTAYRGPDLAQTAFIKAGGPQQDPLGLDPDGDGYACGWDPTPFR